MNGRGGARLLAVPVADVGRGVPLEEHLAGADVDLLHDAVDDLLVGGAAMEVRFAAVTVSAMISAVFQGVMRNSCPSAE
jgi:hypothetical protein